jgi:TetR/AcrR family transcriptional regulator
MLHSMNGIPIIMTSRQALKPSRLRDRARHEVEVLAAAERLFAARGYDATTIAEVAAEAGFAVGTLYNLFGSKEAILDRLLETHLRALVAGVEADMAAAPGPREKLEASVLARVRYLVEHRDFFRLYVSEVPGANGYGDANGLVAVWVEKQIKQLAEVFRELRPRTDPATLALLFFSATRSYIVERVLRAKRPSRPSEVVTVVRTLLDGLAGGRR